MINKLTGMAFILMAFCYHVDADSLTSGQESLLEAFIRATQARDEQSLIRMMHSRYIQCITLDKQKYQQTMRLLYRTYGSSERVESLEYEAISISQKIHFDKEISSGQSQWPVVPIGWVSIAKQNTQSKLPIVLENGQWKFILGCPK